MVGAGSLPGTAQFLGLPAVGTSTKATWSRAGVAMRPLALVLLVMAVAPLALAGRDYYEVLGIEKQATDKDIKRVRAQPHCL